MKHFPNLLITETFPPQLSWDPSSAELTAGRQLPSGSVSRKSLCWVLFMTQREMGIMQ